MDNENNSKSDQKKQKKTYFDPETENENSKKEQVSSQRRQRRASVEEPHGSVNDNNSENRSSDGSISVYSSDYERERASFESSQETLRRLWAPLTKGHEQYNISKPSTSQSLRPVSPPPTKFLSKMKKHNTNIPIESKARDANENDEGSVEGSPVPKGFTGGIDKQIIPEIIFPPKFILDNTFSLHDEDDEEEDEDDYINYNPSGSVLAPARNPYNKQERIRQANIDLFKDDVSETVNGPKIKFNEIVYLLESESTNTLVSLEDDSDSGSEKEISTLYVGSTNYKKRENEYHNAKNDLRDGLKTGNGKPKKLFIQVPNSEDNSDSLNSDSSSTSSSSSENEDVYVGVSVINRIGDRNFHGTSEEISCKGQIKEKGKDKNEETLVKNLSGGGEDGIDPEKLDTDPPTTTDSNKICNINGGGDTSFGPENNTGIQIKITCPSCSDTLNCVEFCSTDNENSTCNTNYPKSPHSCHTEIEDNFNQHINNTRLKQRNQQRDKQHYIPSNLKRYSSKSEQSCLKNVSSAVKNSARSISLNLHQNYTLKTKYNVKTKNRMERKIKDNNKNSKKNAHSENTLLKVHSKKQENQSVGNSITRRNCPVENYKENESQSDVNDQNLVTQNGIKSFEQLKCNLPKTIATIKDNISKQTRRPKSCPEQQSKQRFVKRPMTAPLSIRRGCCTCETSRLPEYNGFRSEYGLSEEQLQERRRLKFEKLKMRRTRREEKKAEEERKRRECEEIFTAWLAKKNDQAKKKRMQNQTYHGYTFRRHSAPLTHLSKNNTFTNLSDSKLLGRPTIDKFLNEATPQEKRTYRIYLGLGTE